MATQTSAFPNVPTQGRALPAFLIVGWRWIGRNPAVAIAPILLPFIFLYFLSFISPPSLLPLEIVGAMLFTMQNIGSWVLGDSAIWRIECSIQDLFVASPLGRLRYLFGIAFSNLIAMLPALVILTVLLAWVGGQHGVPLTPYHRPRPPRQLGHALGAVLLYRDRNLEHGYVPNGRSGRWGTSRSPSSACSPRCTTRSPSSRRSGRTRPDSSQRRTRPSSFRARWGSPGVGGTDGPLRRAPHRRRPRWILAVCLRLYRWGEA